MSGTSGSITVGAQHGLEREQPRSGLCSAAPAELVTHPLLKPQVRPESRISESERFVICFNPKPRSATPPSAAASSPSYRR